MVLIFVIFVCFVIFIIVIADPEAVAKSEMSDDCGGGKMKIDDLIIIPNNINHAEEGGSALQVNQSSSCLSSWSSSSSSWSLLSPSWSSWWYHHFIKYQSCWGRWILKKIIKMIIIHKQLQNLAKIASRYSSLNKDKARAQDFTSPNAKKVN